MVVHRCFTFVSRPSHLSPLPVHAHGSGQTRRPRDFHGSNGKLLLHRMAEPQETAFFFLAPAGWQVEASVFCVNPLENNGSPNSLMAKTNLELKSDAIGACLIHFLPIWIAGDFTGSGLAYNAAFYPIGSNYV